MKTRPKTPISRYFYSIVLFVTLVLICPATKRFFFHLGQRWFYITALSFGLAFCLTPLFRSIAIKLEILDRPGRRKIHEVPTPLLGGAAIFIAFVSAILINGIYTTQVLAILGAGTVLFIVGIIDDARELRASFKLFFQVLCALLVIYFGVILDAVPRTLGIFGEVLNAAITLIWIVGITNAMNFFDGMDGLATGLGAIVGLFLAIVSFQTGQPFLGWLSLAIMGGCFGFLPYNLRIKKRASIFLGDAGSTVLGFIVACLAVFGNWSENSPIVSLTSPLLIFWVLIFDMVHITLDRIGKGKVSGIRDWINYVGKDHLHHRLQNVMGGPKKSVILIYLLSVTLGISAVALRNARAIDALLLLLQASIIVVLVTVLEREGGSSSAENKP